MGEHCRVEYRGVESRWARGFANIYDTAFDGFREVLGIDLPETVTIDISVTGKPTRLWTDGQSRIILHLEKEEDLLPTSRYHNLYGMCHEPGHIAMYSRMGSLAGLPDGVAEGWAHYCGSVICDYVWSVHGKYGYPEPYEYNKDGAARLVRQYHEDAEDAVTAAAYTFWLIGDMFGHRKVGAAMLKALEGQPTGAELMPRFVEALGKDAGGLVPAAMLVSAFSWDSALIERGKEPPAAYFHGLKRDKDGFLRYDDDSNEGMRSSAGSGHAAIFHREGGGMLTAVKLKGARYGPETSSTQFRLTLLDGDFNQLAQYEYPFMLFERRGEPLYWVELEVPKTKVPEVFFVAVDFRPTATDGIYVGIDESCKGHSFSALPGGHLRDFAEGEWMIRAKVK